MKEDIMKFENTLPVEFDGVFKFTNWSDEEFVGKWGNKEYHFPANSTSPMIIPEHSPLEIQHIRKKFAKDLSELQYFKSPFYEHQRSKEGTKDEMGMIQPRGNGMSHAGAYTINDLMNGIQKCLTPLEVKRAFVQTVQSEPLEDKLTRDEEGELHTQAIDKKTSLRDKALNGKGLKD